MLDLTQPRWTRGRLMMGQNFGMSMPGWYDIVKLGRDVSEHPLFLTNYEKTY